MGELASEVPPRVLYTGVTFLFKTFSLVYMERITNDY
jgi:hypothetical protein